MTFVPDRAVVSDVAQCLTTGTGHRYDAETETIVTDQPAILLTMREGHTGQGGRGPLLSEEKSLTLATSNNQTLFDPKVMSVDLHQVTSVANRQKLEEGPARTLHSSGNAGVVMSKPPVYGVRRLTPVECERLQGFPDGWTNVNGSSDSSRYKAMGNAVTVNTVRWILGRLKHVEGGQDVS